MNDPFEKIISEEYQDCQITTAASSTLQLPPPRSISQNLGQTAIQLNKEKWVFCLFILILANSTQGVIGKVEETI